MLALAGWPREEEGDRWVASGARPPRDASGTGGSPW
jgi:hypothetical protein